MTGKEFALFILENQLKAYMAWEVRNATWRLYVDRASSAIAWIKAQPE